MFRRVAAHRVEFNGKTMERCVVEIEDGRVVNYYTFTDELPLTEWLGGTITITRTDDCILSASWRGQVLK